MSENIKKVLLPVLAVLAVIFFILAFKTALNNRNQLGELRQEISKRMDLEEKIAGLEREKEGILADLREVQHELTEKSRTLELVQRELSHEKLINRSLKNELDKISKPGVAPEQDLEDLAVEEGAEEMN